MHTRKTNEAKNSVNVYIMLFSWLKSNQGCNTNTLQGLLPSKQKPVKRNGDREKHRLLKKVKYLCICKTKVINASYLSMNFQSMFKIIYKELKQ